MYKTSHKQKAGWRLKSVLLSLLLLFSGAVIFGQERSISGTIVDNSGAPLPGVNVIIKGTTTGTVSDMDGKFAIKADASATLEFKYVGYVSQEIPVGEQTSFSVTLKEDVQELNEVVVIGYGVQKKKLNTGATLNVAGENIQALKTNSPIEALKGITPGVSIVQNSGLPGSGTRVNIRGVGTIGNSKPLYIVDGIAVGDIDYLSPSDIESIDVLKDAASSAIYGSRAANGVVLVTTKTGTKDMRTVVTYDAYYGVSNIYKKPKMLNAKQYMEVMDEANYNTINKFYYDSAKTAKGAYKWSKLIPNYDDIMSGKSNGTNWIDEIENKNAVTQSHSLNILGGSKKATYSLGASYYEEQGILGKQTNNKYKRINIRMNTSQVLIEKNGNSILTIGENMTFTNTKKPAFRSGSIYWNDLHNMLVTSPLLPVYDSVGKFSRAIPWNVEEVNPIALMEYNDNYNYNSGNNINASAYAEFQPIKGLILRSTYAGSNWYGSSRQWIPVYDLSAKTYTTRDQVNQSMYNGFTYTWTNVATFNKALDKHDFTFLLGNEMTKTTQNLELKGHNENSIFGDEEHAYLYNVPSVDASYTTVTGKDDYGWGLLSYFGRLSYDYNETYMFTFVLRADGSSNFPKGHRWGTFPSVSAGWIVSNESFMDWSKSWLGSLKVRASWGQNGNQDMPNGKFQYLATQTYNNDADYFFGTDKAARTVGCFPTHVTNYDVTWETSEQTDLGMDMYFMNNNLQFTFDYYDKETKDWLVQAPIVATAGTAAAYSNGGTITNKGVELSLRWNDRSGDFKYGFTASFAYNKNEVTKLNSSDSIIHGATNVLSQGTLECYRAQVDYPISYFYGYKTDGIFQDTLEVEAFTRGKASYYTTKNGKKYTTIRPGDIRYVDVNGDTIIDEKDKQNIGNPNPKYIVGFQFDASYKGFYVLATANGSFGHQVLMSYRSFVDGPKQNYTTDVLDSWNGVGTSNRLPRLTTEANDKISDIYVEDADFLKISNITVGYDFKFLFKSLPLTEAKLYVAVKNLHTFTSYKGMDPEVGYSDTNYPWATGIDLGLYPAAQTYLVGLSLKF